VLLPVLGNRASDSAEVATAIAAVEHFGPAPSAAVPLLEYWSGSGDSLASVAASAALKRLQPVR
jgi:hypothetical protein